MGYRVPVADVRKHGRDIQFGNSLRDMTKQLRSGEKACVVYPHDQVELAFVLQSEHDFALLRNLRTRIFAFAIDPIVVRPGPAGEDCESPWLMRSRSGPSRARPK